MINMVKEITSYSDSDEYFEDFLRKVYLVKIFEEIFIEFPIREIAIGIIKFIVWSFSVDSDMTFISGGTWDTLSKNIFKRTKLPQEYFEQVAKLESLSVQKAATKWLDFQNEEHFKQYKTYEMLRAQFLELAVIPIKVTGTLEEDSKLKNIIDAKMNAAVNSKELLKLMLESKDTFIQNNLKLKESVSALNRAGQQKTTRSTEEIFASEDEK